MLKAFWSRMFPRVSPGKKFSAWQIELTTRCALRCVMCCRQGHEHLPRKDMSMQDFERIIPYLQDVESVVLEGWGESLLHPHLLDAVRLVKKAGTRVGFVTSGMGLNRDYVAALVEAKTDFIGFSLSGAEAQTHEAIRVNSRLAEILDHIQMFQELKARNRSAQPHIHIVYLLLKKNLAEVPALIRMAKDLGVPEILLIHMALITNPAQEEQRIFGREDRKEEEGIIAEAQKLARKLRISLKPRPLLSQEVAVCSEDPLRNLYISVNGNVSPCVYLRPPVPTPFRRIFHGAEVLTEKVGFGNIFRTPFPEIWNHPEYESFRACYSRRREMVEKMTAVFWDPDKWKAGESRSFPPPPAPCRTCYKVEGF